MEQLEKLTKLCVTMSNMIHEQQKERGTTAVFLGSHGARFTKEMQDQRKQTDEKQVLFENYLMHFDAAPFGPDFIQNLENVKKEMGKLGNIRSQIDSQSIALPNALKYYTDLNALNMKLTSSMASLSHDATITNYLHTYVNFLQSKERAGIERAVGAGAFAGGSFSKEISGKFRNLINIQDTYLQVFEDIATDEQKKFYHVTVTGQPVDEVARMRKVAFETPEDVSAVDSEHWFKMITQKINLLKTVEDNLAGDLDKKMQEIKGKANSNSLKNSIIALFAMVLTLVVSLLITRGINASLQKTVTSMLALANGNIETSIPEETRNEIGEMAKALTVFKKNKIEADILAEDQKRAQQQQIEHAEKLNNLTKTFENDISQLIARLTTATTELDSTAQSMAKTAEQTSEQAQAMSASSQSTALNIQGVAGATEQLTASIRELSQQVNSANESTRAAVVDVDLATRQVESLSLATEKISDIIKLIQNIAEQTNLLALNATIESARAGEAGKGFAVVASEVKSLATETGKATEQIAQQIQHVQGEAKTAVEAIRNIEIKIRNVNEVSSSIAAAIEEQNASTLEISRNTQVSSVNMQELDGNVRNVNEAAQNSGGAATQVLNASRELDNQITRLKEKITKFLQDVNSV